MKRKLSSCIVALVYIAGLNAWALEPNSDGIYEIGSADDFMAFAELVNSGTIDANAVLTTDIDMAEQSASFPMIGTSSNPYAGNFDGQFHTISNLKLSRNSADVALFSYVQPGCTIQNLVLDETCSSEGADYTAGIVSRFTGSHQSIYLLNLGYEGTVTGTGKNSGAIQANSPSGGPITVMRNCYSTGKVSGSIECGQLSGWVGKDAIVENCWSTSEVEGYQNDGSYMYRKSSSTQTNCYSLYGTQATSISEEQIQSGELCFLLNGNQNTINWYQTLGEDAHPTLYPNHNIVYVNGNLACDGVTPLEGVTTFSNTPGANIAPHTFDCGFCTICHAENPDFIVEQEDGYWQIGTAEQLTWFANKVTNLRQIDASAQLTADIDMAEYCDKFPMIGTSSAPYAGTFDGQFHTISNLKLERETDNVALFSYAQPGCTIQNLILDETCSASGVTYTAGIVSRFAGSANPIYLLNLGYEGTVTGTGKNSGAIHSNSPSGGPITVMRNCYSTGKISGAGECGQLSGWVGTNSIVENCWSTSEVIGYQSNDFYLYRRGSTYTIKNCYSLYGSQGTTITEEQIENGELCWLLNNGKFEYTSAWYETLGEDSHPVLSPTHDAVYKACDTYGSVNKVSLNVGSKAMSEALLAYTENEELTATQSLIEAYTTKARALAEATSWEELVDGYAELDAIGQSIRISQAAYVSYQNKVEEARTFLAENPDVSGEYCDILIKYLSEYLEKGGDFPNGSYSYIMDTHTLTTEELAAETDYMSLLLRQAVEGGYVKDSDVTNLLVNANFRNGFEGWKGIVGTGWGVSETSSVRVAECRNHAMDMYQIITGLKDGVYELQVSGAFHPYPEEDHQNTNYAAMLYANTLQNYFQAGIEDMVSVDDAVDGENCHLTGDAEDYMVINDGAEAGYIPHGIAGYSNAFQAGRYVNSILANVTDGTLTVGVKLAGTGNSTSDMTTTVTAHSGAYSTEANSMRFISTALIRRPDILEVDVRCRPNGTLAISHDAIASDEGGVELATVFAAVAKTSVRMNLDIKETATLEPLHTLIAEYGMEKQVFMTGLSEKDIELAKRDCPGIPYYLNYNPDTKRTDDEEYQQMILALLERTGSLGINCNYKYATKALASLLHKNGYLLSVWTVNAESDMRNMLAISPDNITTLNPDLLYSLMRNSNPAPDQLGFGKITLTYRGPLEESAQALDRVLASQAARANTILNNYEYSIDVDYASYPNFAQEIKDALQDAIDAIATTTEAEAKYALVERFSDLFQQVYDCKKAYVSLMTQAEWLVDASGGMNNVLDDEERQTLSDLMETLIEGYMDGTFSFEEAQQNYLADLPFILKKTDGVYQIGTGRELAIFSAMVNAGDHTANAVLTADIDMSDYSDKFVPIGSSAYPYAATFDGQFHTISHLNLTRETNDVALFGYVKPGCTIQNLLLDETCSSAGVDYTAGIVSRFTGNHQPIYLLNLGYEGTVSGTGKNSGAIHANSPSAGPITVMRNCYSTGNVSGSLECGQLSGWVGQDAIVENCWSTSEVSGYQNDASYMYRRGASYTQTNCYSLYGTQATSISEEQMQSGELCFLLNGDQSAINWYQTLSEDSHPVLLPNHSMVYMNGNLACDGVTPLDDNRSYSNTPGANIAPHTFDCGFCALCHAEDPDFVVEQKDGYWQIGTAEQLTWFANKVTNLKQIGANAQLTADIDMAECSDKFPMIGTSSNPYAATFDGQFHTISNLKLSRDASNVALFSYAQPGCTIQNLVLDETCSSEGIDYTAGIVSRFAGSANPIYLLNLGYEGTVTGTGKNSGAIQANSPSGGPITVMRNCYSTGKVSGSLECGQLSGWVGKNAIVENCWSTSEVEGYQNDGSYMYRKSSATQTNCYSLYGTQATPITEEQMSSGELCWLLNGDQSTINWYQTLGEDSHPVLLPTHSVVTQKDDGTYENATSIQNAKCKMQNANVIYDLSGRRVNGQWSKGVYIVNGKKVLVE